jgi:hypothetical protein
MNYPAASGRGIKDIHEDFTFVARVTNLFGNLDITETTSKSVFQTQIWKSWLIDNGHGKGSQVLIFKLNIRNFIGSASIPQTWIGTGDIGTTLMSEIRT